MGSLAYRSSKLVFKSSALAYNNPWTKMAKSAEQNLTGQAGCTGNWDRVDQYWPYMADWNGVDTVDVALSNFNSASWVAGAPSARMQAAHSHGLFFNGYSMQAENFFLYQEGYALFGRPSGYPTITEARLWLGNAGEIFHTIQDEGRYLWVNQFDGLFANAGSLPYLNNPWLEIVISVSSSIYHVITLSRGDLATLNAQFGNGKVVAGLGSYSYMYSGSVYLTLPSNVIAMLNNYTGVGVDIYWNWSNAILGPACQNCLQYSSYSGCASPWATRTSLARLGDLEIR